MSLWLPGRQLCLHTSVWDAPGLPWARGWEKPWDELPASLACYSRRRKFLSVST